jgi:hypothetical protein
VSKASHLSGGSGGATTATYPRLVSRRHQRALVSIGTTICVVFAAAAPLVPGSHREPPGYALESSVVLYLERLLAAFLISYVVFVIIVRSLIRGELPSTMSREGLTWSKGSERRHGGSDPDPAGAVGRSRARCKRDHRACGSSRRFALSRTLRPGCVTRRERLPRHRDTESRRHAKSSGPYWPPPMRNVPFSASGCMPRSAVWSKPPRPLGERKAANPTAPLARK